MKTTLLCLLCPFIIVCTHQSIQENCIKASNANAICVSIDTFWKAVRMKKPIVFMDDEIIPTTPPIYYYFSFPIKYYETTSSEYFVPESLWNDKKK